ERDLLEKTLSRTVGALANLVHLAGPALSMRSEAIRAMVVHMATTLGFEEVWQFELAAKLCLIGCIALPIETFERAYVCESVSPDEKRMFREHPENGAQLLADIPRLENVAEMIQQQQTASGPHINTVVERG